MGAQVVLETPTGHKTVGVFGVVHPEVLVKYEVDYPCSIVELDIDLLML